MGLSVTEPISHAMIRTKRILFDPFDIKKWFVLGFCAWLATLGEGGGWNISGGQDDASFSAVKDWVLEHLMLVIILGCVVTLILLAIGVLLLWIRSRGKFMFLDGVVHNRAAVGKPWSEYRVEANSLFWFLFLLAVISSIVGLLVIAICGMLAWPDIIAEDFGSGAITAIIVMVVVFVPMTILYLLIESLTENFVIPVMYLRRIKIREAWAVTSRELLQPYLGSIILFYLMLILISIVFMVIVMLVTLFTCCCIAIIPYIGTVILLPLIVFMRCYSLCFMEQAGPHLKFFPDPRDADDLMPSSSIMV